MLVPKIIISKQPADRISLAQLLSKKQTFSEREVKSTLNHVCRQFTKNLNTTENRLKQQQLKILNLEV